MLAYGRNTWSAIVSLSVWFVIPSYFKFVVESNSLTWVSMVCLGLLSIRQKFTSALTGRPLSIKHAPVEVPFDIKVLSYNIFLRPPFIKNNADDFKNERLAEFINHIDQYDIISLQEMFCLANTRQRTLLAAAYDKGFKYYTESVNASWRSGKFIDAGLLIMSKYPIIDTGAHIYRSGNQIDGWAAKQVIYAKIQVTSTLFLHVFDTHLQASYFDSHADHNKINDFARADQVTELADFVKLKTKGSPYPVLVTGDFNINSREVGAVDEETKEYAYMMSTLDPDGTGLRDLLKETYDGKHPITYGDVVEETVDGRVVLKPKEVLLTHTADHCCGLSIDYVFFGDTPSNKSEKIMEVVSAKVEEFQVDASKVKCAQLSDHYGIVTTLRVNRDDVCIEGDRARSVSVSAGANESEMLTFS